MKLTNLILTRLTSKIIWGTSLVLAIWCGSVSIQSARAETNQSLELELQNQLELYEEAGFMQKYAIWKNHGEMYPNSPTRKPWLEENTWYSKESLEIAARVEQKYAHLSVQEINMQGERQKYTSFSKLLSVAEKIIEEKASSKKLWLALNEIYYFEYFNRGFYVPENLSKYNIDYSVLDRIKVLAEKTIARSSDSMVIGYAHVILGRIYAFGGTLVRQNLDTAKQHLVDAKESFGQACDLGNKKACIYYNRFHKFFEEQIINVK
ncbi:hypothetical protein KZ326_07125 [Glaesserella parasuis]|nr:hypothetical protein [Glaesserella parasuis]